MGARRFGPGNHFLQEDRYDDALADLDLSVDPLTSNRYSLAGGNPVNFVEYDGHFAVMGLSGDNRTAATNSARRVQESDYSSPIAHSSLSWCSLSKTACKAKKIFDILKGLALPFIPNLLELGKDLVHGRLFIAGTRWVRRGEFGLSIKVKPTRLARDVAATGNPAAKPLALMGFEELRHKAGLKENLPSMRWQYICHAMSPVVSQKSTWNLEPARANVGLAKTVKAFCNPKRHV
jgi:hypothetical protein